MADNRIEFRYSAQDVASAQRMRFFRSSQFKGMLAVWLISAVLLLVMLQFFPPSPLLNRPLVLAIAIAYVLSMVGMVFLTPYLHYAMNRFWRLPFQLHFNDRQLRLSVVKGKSRGLELAWEDILLVQENTRVIVLNYGEKKKFIILPKSAFSGGKDGAPGAAERRFRELLRRRGPQSVPAIMPSEVPPSEAPPTQAQDSDS